MTSSTPMPESRVIRVPRFKSCYATLVFRDDLVALLSETTRFLLQGELIGALARLIDGSRTTDAIVDELADRFDPAQLYYQLLRLAKERLIEEATPAEPAAAAFWTLLESSALIAPPPVPPLRIRLTGVGAVSLTPVTAALEQLRFPPVAGEGGETPCFSLEMREQDNLFTGDEALAVVVTTDYLEPELAAINQAALQAKRPWVLAKPAGVQPWLGPLFMPGTTGCWECLNDRLGGYRSAVMQQSPDGVSTRPLPLSRGSIQLSLNLAAGFLALELAKWHTGCPEPRLVGQVLSIDYRTSETRLHRLIRRPHCPACGQHTPRIARRLQPAAPMTLLARRKSGHRDNGHRVCLAVETCQALAHHISPITGAIGDLERIADIPEFLGFHFKATYPARTSPDYLARSLRSAIGVSGGKGRTETQARASAIGECIERHSARFEGHEPRVHAPFTEIREVAVHPHALTDYSGQQYLNREAWNQKGVTAFVADPYSDETEISWTAAWSLSHNCWKLVPSCCAYMGYPTDQGRSYVRGDSNGVAAGNCLEEAIMQGIFELVERDAVAIWWYNRIRRPQLDLDSFQDDVATSARDGLQGIGRDLHVLDLTHDLNIPVFAAVSLAFNDPTADPLLGFGAHFDASIALSRALTELGQSWHFGKRFKVEEYVLRFQDRPLSQMEFLQPLSDAPARARASFADASADDFAADIRHCVDLFQQVGLETLLVDLTRPDLALSVARVIVPGLRHFWPRFAPGRLYDAPVQLGWLERSRREEELNPVPFYF